MKPYITDLKPLSMFSAPSDGPTVRSSTISIGAASAPARISSATSLASRVVIRPLIWTRPPPISSRMTGRRDHLGLALLDEHDGHPLADVLARHFLEDARAGAVQIHVHRRFVGALVEAGLRVLDAIAGEHDLPPHDERLAAALGEEVAAERHAAGERALERAGRRR